MLCVGLAVSTISPVSTIADTEKTAQTTQVSNFYIAGASMRYMSAEQAAKDENGIRFAIAMEDNLFNSLLNASKSSFKEGVVAGALVLPADLTEETVLTKNTQVQGVQNELKDQQILFNDFSGTASVNEYAGIHVAYVTLYNFPVDDYNKEYMVSAYYKVGEETVYTQTVTASMAQVAKAAASIETNEVKKAGLLSYVKDYAVNVYVDGVKKTELETTYGETVEESNFPVANEYGYCVWYQDQNFKTEFDFEAPILGETNVYGKFITVASQTGGLLSSMDSTFVYNADDNTFTQKLVNSTAAKGYAALNVEAGKDFYVSADISLSKWIAVASQGWDGVENDRLGFALMNASGDNYRMQFRSAMAALQIYGKSSKSDLYKDEGVNATYLLGSTNVTSNEVYQKETPYLQLKNTANLNHVKSVKLAMSKIGNNLTFYVNGEVVATQEVEANFNGVPALFAYSYEKTPAQRITYSNVIVMVGKDAQFANKTADFSVVGGNLTHALAQEAGYAQFDVDGTKDYTISFTANFSKAIAYDNGQAAGGAEGHNNRVGVNFYDATNGVYYNFALSMVWRNAVRIINENGRDMYNDTNYTLDDGSDARKSFYSARDQYAKMGDEKMDITMKKVGNTISVAFNGYVLETLTVAENANIVPAILSYDLQASTSPMTITYTNIICLEQK